MLGGRWKRASGGGSAALDTSERVLQHSQHETTACAALQSPTGCQTSKKGPVARHVEETTAAVWAGHLPEIVACAARCSVVRVGSIALGKHKGNSVHGSRDGVATDAGSASGKAVCQGEMPHQSYQRVHQIVLVQFRAAALRDGDSDEALSS